MYIDGSLRSRRRGRLFFSHTRARQGGLSTGRGGPSTPKNCIIKKVARSIQIQRHSSSPTGLSGGCAKPIFDHAREKSANRQSEGGLMLPRVNALSRCPQYRV